MLHLRAVCAVAAIVSLHATSAAAQPGGEFPIPKSVPATPDDLTRARDAAERGDREAEFTLCFAQFTGAAGAPRDRRAALPWCRRASAHGLTTATFRATTPKPPSGTGCRPTRPTATVK